MAAAARPAARARRLHRHADRRRRRCGHAAVPLAPPRVITEPSAQAFDAVVWDYDGTLVDTRSSDVAAVETALARGDIDPGGIESFWASEGRPIAERIELAWPGRVAQVLPLFDGGQPPVVFPGVRPVLRELRRRGMPLAVVSSRRFGPLLRGLASSRLRGWFAVVIGLETVHAPKPDPEGLLLALERLGVHPGRAAVVGDRDADLEAARRAGATGWRAVWGLGDLAPSERSSIDLLRPEDVLDRLDADPPARATAAAG
ncbi:MAG TPA: HAD-IA family hydrolase [Candidatus Dormibacteraeota bacterium]|nr:HAD-IA family hydrolase [Candidatus Dormibacteraeota bacterium]